MLVSIQDPTTRPLATEDFQFRCARIAQVIWLKPPVKAKWIHPWHRSIGSGYTESHLEINRMCLKTNPRQDNTW